MYTYQPVKFARRMLILFSFSMFLFIVFLSVVLYDKNR